MVNGSGRFLAAFLAMPTALALFVGCSSETAGEAQDPASSHSEASGQASGTDLPGLEVSKPLAVDPFVERPCALVPQRVVAELGGGTSHESKGAVSNRLGPSCTWDLKKKSQLFHVLLGTAARDMGGNGLAELYANVRAGMGGYVEAADIPGHPEYPAAFGTLGKDKRSQGYCPVNVGTSNDMVVTVSFENREQPSQACPAALKVAASVLDTLKKGS